MCILYIYIYYVQSNAHIGHIAFSEMPVVMLYSAFVQCTMRHYDYEYEPQLPLLLTAAAAAAAASEFWI